MVKPTAFSLFKTQEPNPAKEINAAVRYGRNCNQSKHFSARLYHLQQEKTLCDITIIVGDKPFRAHKVVLAAACDYFETMLTSGFKESGQSEIRIDGDGYAFGKLLQFAYCGELYLSKETVIRVLTLACYMHFPNAVKMCSRFLITRFINNYVSCEDAYLVAMLARLQGKELESLHTYALEELSLNFETFVKTDTFLQEASDTFLEDFLGRDYLARHSKEGELLIGVTNWLHYDWTNRRQHAVKLLKMLRLGAIPDDKLEMVLGIVQTRDMPECQEALELHRSKGVSQKPRNIITTPVAIGGLSAREIQYYDPDIKQKWRKLNSIPKMSRYEVTGHAMVMADNKLYVAGGCYNNACEDYVGCNNEYVRRFLPHTKTFDTLREYDPVSDTWHIRTPLHKPRREFSLVQVDDNFLYAIGGFTSNMYTKPTQQMERYSIHDDQWTYVAPMNNLLKDPSAVVIDAGYILVYGQDMDFEGNCSHSYSLLKYDIRVNEWQRLGSEQYTAPSGRVQWKPFPLLTVHDGKCYRICRQIENPVHVDNYKSSSDEGVRQISCININEDGGRPIAAFNKVEEEVDLKCLEAFCIQGKVYLYLSSHYVYNTGIDAANASMDQLEKIRTWNSGLQYFESVASFTFDILKKRSIKSYYNEYTSTSEDDSIRPVLNNSHHVNQTDPSTSTSEDE